jgi:hypothetical protein
VNIHWNEDAPDFPGTFEVGDTGLFFFYYGNYGGPAYPNSAELETGPGGSPLPVDQLSLTAEDLLDYHFYVHDAQSLKAGPNYNKKQAQADINLINSLTYGDQSYNADPEASLYDGLATLAMIGQLAIHNKLGLISPTLLLDALTDAAHDIQFGIQGVAASNPIELAALFDVVADGQVDGDVQLAGGVFTYRLPFTFPDISSNGFVNELVEATVIAAVQDEINEVEFPAFQTFLTDNYVLQFSYDATATPKADVDLQPVLLLA